MRIKKHIKAFTLTEAMVCFMIIGLIFIATITNIGKNDHYDKLYWQAFNTLYQASKAASSKFEKSKETNYMEKWVAKNHRIDRSEESGTHLINRKYPGFLRDKNESHMNGYNFCKRLTETINTLNPEHECKSNDIAPNVNITSTKGKIGVNFYKGFSYVEKGEGGTYDVTTPTIEPSFTTVNGQKFYISQVLTANYDPESEKFAVQERESFRFVIVDLNGDSGPNTQFIKSTRNPDVVLFAIDSEGNVIPLGLPEWSKAYISAMATYPSYLNSDGTPVYPLVHSPIETLWHAKKRAWGNKIGECSARGGANYLQNISQYEAMSQSTKFYYNASVCIDNPSDCADKERNKTQNYVDEDYTYLVTQFLYKEEGSSDYYDYLMEDDCNSEHSSLDEKNGCEAVQNYNTAPTCGIDFKH